MKEKTNHILEFDQIKNMLIENAVTNEAKKELQEIKPYLSLSEVTSKIKETTEAKKMIECIGTPPLPTMKDINKYLELAGKGAMLTPENLSDIAIFLVACKRMKNYLKKGETLNLDIAYYGNSIVDLTDLANEINQSIRGNQVDDTASKELKDIRRKMESTRTGIKLKLESILRGKKEYFTDNLIATRNGHFVLPVKKEYKHQIGGSILDISSTGSTHFIVPSAVLKLEEELSSLKIEEENEVRKVLYTLTALFYEEAISIKVNMEALQVLDFIFAKGKLSIDMQGVPANMNYNRHIQIVNGRHPLLKAKKCIPLNFVLERGINGIVITGPNTGGKTVALKTIGLFHLMSQSGLHVPCEEADLCLTNQILCDIGDGQSISENLSTFSSHISNIIDILSHSDKDSLILLDELGSGTDPQEGMGIAIAILEELKAKGCLFLATTHYPEVKEYAAAATGLLNARMAFDKISLKPLYELEIGEAGESCALYIAKRLGLPNHMLERAYKEAYSKDIKINTDSNRQLHQDSNQKFISKPAIETEHFLEQEVKRKENNLYPSQPQLKIDKPIKTSNNRSSQFVIGDSVMVYPQKKIGIVFKTANEQGEIGVQIQKKKDLFNHKRLKRIAKASDMYPEDYDFSIIFDSVENRKARHKMDKGHQPGLEIKYDIPKTNE